MISTGPIRQPALAPASGHAGCPKPECLGVSTSHVRLLIAGAYRTVDVRRGHPLQAMLAALHRGRLSETVRLTSFSEEECSALILKISAHEAAPLVSRTIHQETGGNPFLIEEVVQNLLAEGRDLTSSDAAVQEWSVPAGVREVIDVRLSRLGAEANRLLEAATVLGDGLHFDVLADVSQIEVGTLLDAVDEVVTAGILQEEGDRYVFSHALIRQAVAEKLSQPRRQRLYLQAATAIERNRRRNLDPYLGTIAEHYRQAGYAAAEQTLTYARRAAESAVAQFAYEDAARFYLHALEAMEQGGTEDEAERADLLLALGNAQMRAGESNAAWETFEAAAAIARTGGQPEQLARAALGFGATSGTLGSGSRNEVWLHLLQQPYYLWHLQILRASQSLMACRFDEAERLIAKAYAEGQIIEEDEAMAYYLSQQSALLTQLGRLAEIVPAVRKRAEEPGRAPAWSCRLVQISAVIGRQDEALEQLERLAADGFAAVPRDGNWINSITTLVDACNLLGAQQYAPQIYELLRPYAARIVVAPVFSDCRGAVSRSLGLLATMLARWEEAEAYFADALATNTRLNLAAWSATTQIDYARMLCRRNRDGDRDLARSLLRQTRLTAKELGMVALAERASGVLAAGLRTENSGKSRHEPVQTRPPLLAAESSAAHPVDSAQDRELDIARSVPRSVFSPQASVFSPQASVLTSREIEVWRLMAAGLTNREIAAELVLAVDTVRRHTSNIYAKIGVRRRADATAYAFNHGLAGQPAAGNRQEPSR
ncbi:MAG: ATP-binding protein [Dehalococcoidia bacterium]